MSRVAVAVVCVMCGFMFVLGELAFLAVVAHNMAVAVQ